jgi:hypothetical protein
MLKGQAPQASSTKPVASWDSASPTVTNVQLNSLLLSDNAAESEPSTTSVFPPGFDRGRFPYQRRRRGGLVGVGYTNSKSHHKVPIPVLEQAPNLPPEETTEPLPKLPTTLTTLECQGPLVPLPHLFKPQDRWRRLSRVRPNGQKIRREPWLRLR